MGSYAVRFRSNSGEFRYRNLTYKYNYPELFLEAGNRHCEKAIKLIDKKHNASSVKAIPLEVFK